MADLSDINGLVNIQERQSLFLIESLAAMRVAEKADVVIVCGGKEFYAHKVILEANSPYFTTMFQSNLEEAKSGKVFFNDMEPETLDAILDFLYLGDVKKLKTDEQLMNVLEASHIMELQHLFQFCSTSLLKTLSPQNFLAIWTLAEKYEEERMLTEVKNYFLGNAHQILTSKNFLTVNVNQLKDLVVLFKSKIKNIDKILKGIVLWLLHDLPAREQFTGELFAYIDANRVSKQFAKSLLDDSEMMAISKELGNRLKDLVIETCFVEEKEFLEGVENVNTSEIKTTFKSCGRKLFVLQQQNATKITDGPGEANSETIGSFVTCIQLFDLDTMTWHPAKKLTCVNFKVDAICECNTSIFLVGSTEGNSYVLYDPRRDTLLYVKTKNNLTMPNAGAIYFQDFIYLVGGTSDNDTGSRVSLCLKPGGGASTNEWDKTSPLNHSWSNPVLFMSDKYMFVAGSISSISKQFVEYTDGKKRWIGGGRAFYEMNWMIAELPKAFINVDVHFFPYNNELCGVYNSNGVFVKLTFKDGNWQVDESRKKPLLGENKLHSISYFPTLENPFALISAADSMYGIPNYLLDMEALDWANLPEPRGVCGIKEGELLLSTTC